MPKAACGHTVDLWCANERTVCKDCFEGQGFTYNENSYRDLEHGAARSGSGTRLRGTDNREDELNRKKRECAEILNPHLTSWNTPGSKRTAEATEARRAAFALVKEKFGIGRSTASQFAKEFRTAA